MSDSVGALRASFCAVAVFLASACGGGGSSPGDGAVDAGPDAADAQTDANTDANLVCTADADCDDGLFCNGVERCVPGDDAANAHGCAPAVAAACDPPEACNEDEDRCLTACDLTGDMDGDGHLTIACGGDDCDDMDANRFPGNVEICDPGSHDEDCDPESFGFIDADMDGVGSNHCCNVAPDGSFNCGGDCDDANGSIRPGAGDGPPAACDGLDNDCDGTVDESCPCTEGETQACGVTPAQIAGIGTCEPGTQICSGGSFTAECVGGRGPQAEICDGLDNDCDGEIDNGVLHTYYRDADGDGFGVDGTTTAGCTPPDGWAANTLDCDDTNPAISPVGTEVCDGTNDENCNGLVDEGLTHIYYRDNDGDGFGDPAATIEACYRLSGYADNGSDCNDTAAGVNVAAIERCDGIDNDCSGAIDEGCSCTDAARRTCGADDGAGGVLTTGACTAGEQLCSGGLWSACVGAIVPGTEICDGLDNDCDGLVDEDVKTTFYRDADGDGFGTPTTSVQACSVPTGYVRVSTDCDDTVSSINPSAVELCDGVDNNCTAGSDEGCSCTDGARQLCGTDDGMGGIVTAGACAAGEQLCTGGLWGSCVGSVAPATEVCNSADDDCDGLVDEGVKTTFYRDNDGDGFGTATTPIDACWEPSGYVRTSTDCNDTAAAVNPSVAELCDGADNNCNAVVDEGCSCVDGSRQSCGTDDGMGGILITGACAAGEQLCTGGLWGSCVGAVGPTTEVCNGADDNCSGSVDEGVKTTFYRDADGDGFGKGTSTVVACSQPSGYVFTSTDCNDASSAIHPGAVDLCDGIDNDCSGTADEGCLCTDGSTRSCGTSDGMGGYVSAGQCVVGTQLCVGGTWGGCIGAVGPAGEVCNSLDDDCDGTVDDGVTANCYQDGDGDGRGTGTLLTVCATSPLVCPTGFAPVNGDCNDANSAVYPGRTETCNAIDDNCNGSVDEGGGRECIQNQILPCTTACGTSGLHTCDASCVWRETVCSAPTETCNYCDDTGDGSIDDETPVATRDTTNGSSCDDSPPDTGLGTVYGEASCYSTSGFPPSNYTRLSNYAWPLAAFPAAGAFWADRPVTLGYTGFVAEASITASDSGSYSPGYGWALVIANDTGAAVGTTSSSLGVPYARHGLAIEWRFNGNSADTLQVRRLTGSGSGTLLGLSAATITASSDPTKPRVLNDGVSNAKQNIRVTYTVANSYTGAGETLQVEVYDPGDGSYTRYVNSEAGLGGFTVGSGFTSTDQLRIGLVSSGSTSKTAGVAHALVDAELNYFIASTYYPFSIAVDGQCIEPEGSLRVSGGDGRTGRLEVFHAGAWGTVCDDLFDANDATVACRQMGFTSGSVVAAASTKDAYGSVNIWLDNMGCAGSESRLDQCAFGNGTCGGTTWGCQDCTHAQDVGVSCIP